MFLTMKILSALMLIAELMMELCNTNRLQRKIAMNFKQKPKDQSVICLLPELDTESKYLTHRFTHNISATGAVLPQDVATVLE